MASLEVTLLISEAPQLKGFLSSPMFLFCSARDTAGQERFRTITTAYYRGAMVRWIQLQESAPELFFTLLSLFLCWLHIVFCLLF